MLETYIAHRHDQTLKITFKEIILYLHGHNYMVKEIFFPLVHILIVPQPSMSLFYHMTLRTFPVWGQRQPLTRIRSTGGSSRSLGYDILESSLDTKGKVRRESFHFPSRGYQYWHREHLSSEVSHLLTRGISETRTLRGWLAWGHPSKRKGTVLIALLQRSWGPWTPLFTSTWIELQKFICGWAHNNICY